MTQSLQDENLQIALKKLKARERSFEQLEAIAMMGSWEIDLKSKKSLWSKQSYINYGYEPFSFEPSLETFFAHLVPEYVLPAKTLLQDILNKKEVTDFFCKITRVNGEVIDLHIQAQTVYDDSGTPLKLIGTSRDVTKELQLERKSQELADIIDNSVNEIYIIDYDTYEYIYVNQGACKALGYTQNEFDNLTLFDTNVDFTIERANYLKDLYQATHEPIINITKHRRKDGSTYDVQAFIHECHYNGKKAIVIFDHDISKRVEAEAIIKEQSEALYHQANHDALTNLPNRSLFKDRLAQTIHAAKRNEEKFALLFIDLDQFKKINDSLGHHIGDEVLIESAKRLQNTLRAEDSLARLGGDEFTIIIKDLRDNESAATVAQKIIASMQEPIKIKSHQLYVSSSIGISLFPDDATDANNLIKFADAAMYRAKDEGRNNFQFYSRDMTQYAFEKVVMESSLRVAIDSNQFEVYFQPQFEAKSDTLVGMEALVRWIHPSLGIIPPGKFIPLSEENGLIIDIDRIVMKKAFEQFALWYSKGLNPGKLALNLSMKRLNEKDFFEQVLQTMKVASFEPQWLELEVTESQVMNNPDASIEKLHMISKLGIELAIDDFGTGYSSLSYLKKLPLDKLKIDQSFVRDIPNDEDDIAITKAIIALAKSLNLKLIAEGVETQAQKDFMIANGCEYIQGYYYSKPIAVAEMELLLKKNK